MRRWSTRSRAEASLAASIARFDFSKCVFKRSLRLLGDDFSVFPDVNRRAVHPRGPARAARRHAQAATHPFGEAFGALGFLAGPGFLLGHRLSVYQLPLGGIVVRRPVIRQGTLHAKIRDVGPRR